MRRSLFLWIFPPYIITVILTALAFTAFAAQGATDFFYDLSSIKLRETALIARNALAESFATPLDGDHAGLRKKALALTAGTDIRLTIIAPSGRVIVDTAASPDAMDLHLDREEVRKALASGAGSAMRKSVSTGVTTTYEAVSVPTSDGSLAVIRVATPLSIIDDRKTALVFEVAFFGLCLSVIVSLLAVWLTRRLSAPILRIDAGARAFSAGRLEERIPEEGPYEVANLAGVLNRMAVLLDERIKTVAEQNGRLAAILNGMSEAVAVVDGRLAVLSSNPAFCSLFPGKQAGNLLSVTRSTELCEFMETALKTEGPLETDITLYGERPRQLRIASAPIDGGKAVLVITDLTRLYRLETVRRDFTSNVSHELKTPITTVKAAIETLRESDLDDRAACSRFLDIASRGAERLEAILADLLSLARIEEEEGKTGIEKAEVRLDDVIAAAIAEAARRASSPNFAFRQDGEAGIVIRANEGLIRQALVNLLDNARKYASEGGLATVRVSVESGHAVVSVIDRGQGIPERDRSRIFERFYRIDKARSRDTGGTGLGLSIVKHIALAHSGSVRLESAEGKGSTFSLLLPLS